MFESIIYNYGILYNKELKMSVKTQIVKGFLEGFVLSTLKENQLSTTEIISFLSLKGYHELSEGTLYPLMLRLESNGLVQSARKYNPLGPSKKIYQITEKGLCMLEEIVNTWKLFKIQADAILKG